MKRSTAWLASAWLALGTVGVAQAHAHLLQASPADGSVLTQAPASFSLKFNEAAIVTSLTLQKAGAALQKLAAPSAAATQVSVPAPALTPGDYTLSYRVLSDDHHIVAGHIHFKVSG